MPTASCRAMPCSLQVLPAQRRQSCSLLSFTTSIQAIHRPVTFVARVTCVSTVIAIGYGRHDCSVGSLVLTLAELQATVSRRPKLLTALQYTTPLGLPATVPTWCNKFQRGETDTVTLTLFLPGWK